MNSMLTKMNKMRNKEFTTNKNKIVYLMDKFIAGKKMYLKNNSERVPVNIQKHSKGQFKVFLPLNFDVQDYLLLYTILQKYIEIEMKHVETVAVGRHIYEPVRADIAVLARQSPRFDVMDNSISINQIQFFDDLKGKGLDAYNLPITIKNIFVEYEKMLSVFYPNVKIETFDKVDPQMGRLANLISTRKQMLYLENTQNHENYFPEDESIISYGSFLGDEVYSQMNQFRNSKIFSLLLYPILYKNENQKVTVLGYIKIWSENEHESIDFAAARPHLTYTYLELLEKIKDTRILRNNITIPQNAIDISEGGLKVKVTDPHLKSIFLLYPEMIMDLQFKIGSRVMDVNVQGDVVANFMDKEDKHNTCIAFSKSNDDQLSKLKKCIDAWVQKPK